MDGGGGVGGERKSLLDFDGGVAFNEEGTEAAEAGLAGGGEGKRAVGEEERAAEVVESGDGAEFVAGEGEGAGAIVEDGGAGTGEGTGEGGIDGWFEGEKSCSECECAVAADGGDGFGLAVEVKGAVGVDGDIGGVGDLFAGEESEGSGAVDDDGSGDCESGAGFIEKKCALADE